LLEIFASPLSILADDDDDDDDECVITSSSVSVNLGGKRKAVRIPWFLRAKGTSDLERFYRLVRNLVNLFFSISIFLSSGFPLHSASAVSANAGAEKPTKQP
jgi:hypothetical protein